MAESGIIITIQYSKTVNEFPRQYFSYTAIICDGKKKLCPIFSSEYKVLHWSIDDPASTTGTEDELLKVF
jgi:protein-tyrosine-phosphatase